MADDFGSDPYDEDYVGDDGDDDGFFSGLLGDVSDETDDTTDDGDGGVLPDALKTLLGASALGVAFTDDPIGFFQALIAEWFIKGILNIFGFFASKILGAWDLFTGVLEDSGGPIYDSFASVGGSFLGIFTGLESTLGDLAASSPFGMLVALLIWIALAYGTVWIGVRIWPAVRRFTIRLILTVIPWA